MVAMGARTTLVGRGAELVMLASAIESAATGTLTAVLVHGEAGVGKTRLTEVIARGELAGLGSHRPAPQDPREGAGHPLGSVP